MTRKRVQPARQLTDSKACQHKEPVNTLKHSMQITPKATQWPTFKHSMHNVSARRCGPAEADGIAQEVKSSDGNHEEEEGEDGPSYEDGSETDPEHVGDPLHQASLSALYSSPSHHPSPTLEAEHRPQQMPTPELIADGLPISDVVLRMSGRPGMR